MAGMELMRGNQTAVVQWCGGAVVVVGVVVSTRSYTASGMGNSRSSKLPVGSSVAQQPRSLRPAPRQPYARWRAWRREGVETKVRHDSGANTQWASSATAEAYMSRALGQLCPVKLRV